MEARGGDGRGKGKGERGKRTAMLLSRPDWDWNWDWSASKKRTEQDQNPHGPKKASEERQRKGKERRDERIVEEDEKACRDRKGKGRKSHVSSLGSLLDPRTRQPPTSSISTRNSKPKGRPNREEEEER